ncbi:MAG: response regulator transcription factor [Candidatus Actinomarinales bacterium]|nr:MAG: response regulator transcription factor [Candidatus Actinomarinales bacterium]
MVNIYINLNGRHESFLNKLEKIDIKSLESVDDFKIRKLQMAITSDDLLEETKKNLSNVETAANPVPKLIVVESENFHNIINLINDPYIDAVNIGASEEELKTRIYSLVGNIDSEELKFENLTINIKTFEAIIDEKILDLTFMEYQLLKFFVENQNTVWSREQLLGKVWGYEYFGGERTVDVHVRRLRVKLGSYSSWIKTVHSVGYKFN